MTSTPPPVPSGRTDTLRTASAQRGTRGPSLVARSLLALVSGYSRAVSPLLPPTCRYLPTCSAYAAEALTVHGAVRGSLLTVRRIARCHPFVAGGYDPVPPVRGRNVPVVPRVSSAGVPRTWTPAGPQAAAPDPPHPAPHTTAAGPAGPDGS